jgi:hypothetical protein
MFELELTTQSPVGSLRAAVVRFTSNGGSFVRNTYDTTPGSPSTPTSKLKLRLKIGFWTSAATFL